MISRDELALLKRAIDDCQVAVKIQTTDMERSRQQTGKALKKLDVRLASIETDLAIIKKYLGAKAEGE